MKFFLLTVLAMFVASSYLSIFEWTLHRFLMHKPFWRFTYPFESHALKHHRIFQADRTYHLQNINDKRTIPMAWWNGPALIVATTSPILLISWLWGAWWISVGFFVASIFYYAAYEYMHWCMHLPRRRLVERSGIYFRLNGHHLLHHRWMNCNFNVVLPIADFLFGTLLTRAKFKFEQAEGESLPNVQPFKVST